MSDLTQMQPSNERTRTRMRLDKLERLVRKLAAAPIRNATIDGPVVVSPRGGVTATSGDGSTMSLSSDGVVSTTEDGKSLVVSGADVQVQAGPGEPWVPFEQIILDQVPGTDGLVPTSPPEVQVIEGNGDVLLAITPVVGEDEDPIVAFTVYVDGVYRLTAFSTTISIAGLPYDVDSTFTVSQSDADGEGPLSEPVTGRPQKIGAGDLAQTIIESLDKGDQAYEIASGSSRIVYAGTDPEDDEKDKDGDTWFRFADGALVGQWRHDGTDWQSVTIDKTMLGELDAAMITTGFLNVALLIQAGAITAEKADIASFKAPLANIGVLVANDVYTSGGLHITKAGSLALIDENATDGRRQYDSTGKLRLSFPMDPSVDAPYLFDGDVVARTLTIKGRASFEGQQIEFSRNSVVTMQRGTTAPQSAPTASTASWQAAAPLGAAPGVGGFWDGSGWLFLVRGTPIEAGSLYSGKPRMARMATDGTVTYTTLTGLPAGSNTPGDSYRDPLGIVKIGTDYYVLAERTRPNPGSFISNYLDITLYRLNSSFGLVGSGVVFSGETYATGPQYANLGTDGTTLYVSLPDPATSGATTYIRTVNTSTMLWASDPAIALPTAESSRFMVGNFDFGAKRFVFQANSDSDGLFRSYTAAGAAVPAENFNIRTPSYVYLAYLPAYGWDGTRFTVWPADSVPFKSSTRLTTLTLRVAASWYSATGGLETPIGPIRSVTLPARSGSVTFTMPAPDNDGTAGSPSSSRLYVGLTDSTLRLQAGEFVETKTLTDPNTTSGAAPKTTNTFPDGVAARFQSAAGTTYMDGAGKLRGIDFGAGPANQIAIDALGNGRVGPMQFTTTLSGYGSTTGHMGGTVLGQLGDGVSSTDAVNKRQLDAGGTKSLARRRNTVAQLTSAGNYAKVLFQTAEETHSDITYSSAGHFTLGPAAIWEITAEITFDAAGTGFRQVLIVEGSGSTVTASNIMAAVTMPSFGSAAFVGVQVTVPKKRLAAGASFWIATYQAEGSLYLVAARNVVSVMRVGA
ncbi:hypothetical protein [Aeromicrobium endophyticum]|uniref:Uncharacterized protein n=1 Tax=Aeromicrobium endophyticum TaxID=2292704 RepID=A0A371PCK2_9ACTN|nr:hypothetical protein [Aeromicrobium endophyticum]REK73637.1 hypothetical protein DX116_08915 [Aeromicrobium endophyticum]